MSSAIFDFLRELRLNNTREWFQSNKGRYDELRADFESSITLLLVRLSEFDPELSGLDARQCIYRIYRDVRFSLDKTPYKTHFGAYMTGYGGRTSPYAGYYVHLEPDNALLSGGVWCPPSPLLKKLRRDIYDSIEEFVGIIENDAFKRVYSQLDGEMLKRMPLGYPVDSPYGYILRHKDFVVSSRKSESYFCDSGWLDRAVEDFRLLCPLNKFLNYTVRSHIGLEQTPDE
jgi:uncharacterized protein (TIGR02453 family)